MSQKTKTILLAVCSFYAIYGVFVAFKTLFDGEYLTALVILTVFVPLAVWAASVLHRSLENHTPTEKEKAETLTNTVPSSAADPTPYAEYRYTPKGGDRYAQVKCPACGAENKLLRGAASVCQYCGQAISSVEQQKPVQLTNKEIMLAETAAVFERLLYSFDEELNAFNSCLEIINVTLNQNTGNDTCTHLSGSMLRFYTKTQNIVSGLRRQTTEFCDEMLTADEDTWQNHEVVSDALTTVREQLQELLPSIYELRASMQNLFVSRSVQRKIRQQTESCFDTAVTVITICCTTLSACLSDINDAKFTNTMTRMKLQREKQ